MIKMEDKIKSISPLISQIALRNLGCYCTERMANDIYYLMETINLLIPDIGEDFIRKKYKEEGKDWDKIRKRIDILSKLIVKVKTFYDPIADKKFDRKSSDANKTQAMFKKHYTRTASKVAIMQRELYDVFVFLVKISTLQRQQIPSEAFKVLEHIGFRKIDLSKTKPLGTQQTTMSGGVG